MAFSAQKTLMAGVAIPSLEFTLRTASGTGGGLFLIEVNPAGVWNLLGNNNDAGSDAMAFSSPDGITFTHRTTPFNGTGGVNRYFPRGICWDPVENQFVCVISNNSNNQTMTSPGEANWSTLGSSVTNQIMSGIAWDSDNEQIVGTTDDDFGNLLGLSSPDGDPWTIRNTFATSLVFNSRVADWGNGYFVGGMSRSNGDFSKVLVTSPDGVTWTERDTPRDVNIIGTTYNKWTNTWCCVGELFSDSGTKVAIYMLPGNDPTGTLVDNSIAFNGSVNAGDGLYDVAAFPGGFIAVGQSSDNKARVYVSTNNGITWSENTTHDLFDVTSRRLDVVQYHSSGKIVMGGSDPSDVSNTHFIQSN